MPDQTAALPTDPPNRRQRLFRLLAIGVAFLPFLAAEGLCRWMDWGKPGYGHDPFIGFGAVRPLFVLDDDESRYVIPSARLDFFRPDSFLARKPVGEFRVFCLGGSTVLGHPYATETSFTTWLELALQSAMPGRPVDVINCGGISYASYRLTPILAEVLNYQPDLIILYTGQNEFLEDRSFDHLESRGKVVNSLLAGAMRLQVFGIVLDTVRHLRGSQGETVKPLLPVEVDARLDHAGGLAEYHRDENWHERVIAQYRFNLLRMIEMARTASVPLLLVNPVSNWRDTSPFKAEHDARLTEEELAEWEKMCEQGRFSLRREHYDVARAAACFQAACEIDPLHAGGWYNLAKCYDAMGEMDKAKAAYLKAKDQDVCPLRILQPMNDAVLEIAAQTQTPLVDAQALFESRSQDGIVGGEWLVDHVHPSIEGHQLLADTLLAKLEAFGLIALEPGWEARRNESYRANLASLDSLYFLKGEQRLENLRYWTKGQADVRRLLERRMKSAR